MSYSTQGSGTLETSSRAKVRSWRDTPEEYLAVADAVEAVVKTVGTRLPAYGRCPYRATITQGVLNAVTPWTWHLRVGSFLARFVDVAVAGRANAIGWNLHAALREGHGGEFHVWVERNDSEGVTVFDSTSRHLPALVRKNGLTWNRPVLPFLFGDPASLKSDDYEYTPHDAVTATFQLRTLVTLKREGLDDWIAAARALAVEGLSHVDRFGTPGDVGEHMRAIRADKKLRSDSVILGLDDRLRTMCQEHDRLKIDPADKDLERLHAAEGKRLRKALQRRRAA